MKRENYDCRWFVKRYIVVGFMKIEIISYWLTVIETLVFNAFHKPKRYHSILTLIHAPVTMEKKRQTACTIVDFCDVIVNEFNAFAVDKLSISHRQSSSKWLVISRLLFAFCWRNGGSFLFPFFSLSLSLLSILFELFLIGRHEFWAEQAACLHIQQWHKIFELIRFIGRKRG